MNPLPRRALLIFSMLLLAKVLGVISWPWWWFAIPGGLILLLGVFVVVAGLVYASRAG